jgi:hypothetical protein
MTNDQTKTRQAALTGAGPVFVCHLNIRHSPLIRHSNFVIRISRVRHTKQHKTPGAT